MYKYVSLTGLFVIILALSFVIYKSAVVDSHAHSNGRTNYQLNFDGNELRLLGLQGLDPLYYTNNIPLSNAITYGFIYNDYELYFTDYENTIPDFNKIDIGNVKLLYEDGVNIQTIKEAVRTNQHMASLIICPRLQLSMEVKRNYITDCEATDYALVHLESGDLGVVYRYLTSDGIHYTVSDSITGNWWVSPIGVLCFSDRDISFPLEFISNSNAFISQTQH